MKSFDDTELREMLLSYEVTNPSPELVARSKHLMREEILRLATEPSRLDKWVIMIVGLAFLMSLCLFYMLTVGTVLHFMLPPYLLEFLPHILYAFTAAGGSLIAGALMVLYFKQFHTYQARHIEQLS